MSRAAADHADPPGPPDAPGIGAPRVAAPGYSPTALALVLGVGLALFLIRLSGPSDLMDNDQLRPAMYAIDALRNGHWICQTDPAGDLASKPPLHTWLVALLSIPGGRVTGLTLYLPSGLAVVGTALLALRAGDRWFGAPSGLLGALAWLLSIYGAKHIALPRTDALFAFTVTLTALLAWRSWTLPHRQGAGPSAMTRWLPAWLSATAATLTKGPLGVALGGCGLLACWWEKRSGRALPLRGSHIPGALLLLLIVGGWFGLACLDQGQALLDRMIGRELVGHLVQSGSGNLPGMGLYKSPFYFLTQFLPWSLAALLGAWRVLARPSAEAHERRFERFLFCWFAFGLLGFSLAPHQRPDLLLPLIPPAAMLAGRELARIGALREPRRAAVVAAPLAAAVLGFTFWHYHVAKAKEDAVVRTGAVRELAERLRARPGGPPPLADVDVTFALQFFLGTAERRVSPAAAAELLSGAEPVLVAVRDPASVLEHLAPGSPMPFEVDRSGSAPGAPIITILSNRPLALPVP